MTKTKKPPTKNDQFIAILSLRVKDLDKLIIPSYPPNILKKKKKKKEDANYFDGKTICAFSAFITTIFFKSITPEKAKSTTPGAQLPVLVGFAVTTTALSSLSRACL